MAKPYEIVGRDGRRRRVVDDDDEVLADGEKLVVGMMARDASPAQKAVADASVRFDDSGCRHQPGPCRVVDRAALDAKAEAYRQMCHDMENAWRNAPVAQPAPAAAAPPVEVEDARPAIPVTDADFARLRQIRDESYRAMVAEMEGAWRRPAR